MVKNTRDLSQFGYRELHLAAQLLAGYCKDPSILDGDNVSIEFNPSSGCVFLVDEECTVAMMNDDTNTLEKWYSCSECGNEGFQNDFDRKTQSTLACPLCSSEEVY